MSRRLPRASSTLFGVRYYARWEDAERVRAVKFPGPFSRVVEFSRGFAVQAFAPHGPYYGARETHTRFDPARDKTLRIAQVRKELGDTARRLRTVTARAHNPADTLAQTARSATVRRQHELMKEARALGIPEHEINAILEEGLLDRPDPRKRRYRTDPQGPYHMALTEARLQARSRRRPVYMLPHGTAWLLSDHPPPHGPHVKVLVDERAIKHGLSDPRKRRTTRKDPGILGWIAKRLHGGEGNRRLYEEGGTWRAEYRSVRDGQWHLLVVPFYSRDVAMKALDRALEHDRLSLKYSEPHRWSFDPRKHREPRAARPRRRR